MLTFENKDLLRFFWLVTVWKWISCFRNLLVFYEFSRHSAKILWSKVWSQLFFIYPSILISLLFVFWNFQFTFSWNIYRSSGSWNLILNSYQSSKRYRQTSILITASRRKFTSHFQFHSHDDKLNYHVLFSTNLLRSLLYANRIACMSNRYF